ncbi:hypothetical protein BGZ46_009081 [Entomortierella lignicola]|nr:hypothetical protein BGZ46_009081 [Entomortierella lignicola]
MSPLPTHRKTSKRKLKTSTDTSSHKAYQRDIFSLDQASNILSSLDTLNDVDDVLAKDTSLSLTHRELKSPKKKGSSFILVRRQTEIPLGPPTSSTDYPFNPTTSTITAFNPPSPTLSSSVSPSPTFTQAQHREAPLSSLAVQLTLGFLAAICFICVFIRCIRFSSRQAEALAVQRRENLDSAAVLANIHASVLRRARGRSGGDGGVVHDRTTETRLVPTNEMTLAGRLNLYQARTGIVISQYPYGQEPLAAEGRQMESVNSFVAPSYDCDVSPPPFMTSSGKPPSYAEIVSPVHIPTPPALPTLPTPPNAQPEPSQET